jgi:hypothetical protein
MSWILGYKRSAPRIFAPFATLRGFSRSAFRLRAELPASIHHRKAIG